MPQSQDVSPRVVTTFHVLALLIPLACVDLALAAWRAHAVFDQDPAMWQWWAGLRPIAFFHLATIILWLLWLHSSRARRRPALPYLALHVWFTLLATLVVFNAAFFHYLDIQLEAAVFGIVAPLVEAGVFALIATEVNPLLLAVPLLVVAVANLFPRIGIWILRLKKREEKPRTPRSRRWVLSWAAAAVALLVTASLLPDGLGSTNFTRQRVPALAIGGAQELTEASPRPTPADQLPLQTRLVTGDDTKPYNVVMIFLESQRAKSTSYYEPSLDTTPVFDELAEQSIVLENAFTALPHTSKALVTSHCGVAPPLDAHNSEGKVGGVAARCLPRLLSDLGYATAYFQSPTKDFENRETMISNLGFEEFYPLEELDKSGFEEVNPLGYEDDIMVQPSVEWAKQQDSPFLLSYMTVTGHYDYLLPDDFEIKHYSDDEVYNLYLNTVRYQDRFVGKLIEGFKEAGLYDNTIFVVAGDHGEGFREHQRRLHNDTIWNEGIQVPMLIRVPGMTSSRVISHPVANTALLPTVADLLGTEVAGGSYDYPSMLAPDQEPVYTSCWDKNQCASVIEGDHKFIHFYGQQPDAYYNLAEDPGETDNLIDELSEDERDHFVSELLEWVEEVNARHAVKRTPAASVPRGAAQ